MKNIEQELKIALDEQQYKKLLNASAAEPVLQTNYYFACRDMPQDTVVRIRLKKGLYSFCYKKLLQNVNGVNVCDERECEIDADTALGLLREGINKETFESLTDTIACGTYFYVGKLDTRRAKFVLDKWTVELDENSYYGTTDFELECECDDLELLEELKKYLLIRFGIAYKPSRAKSRRFFERLSK